MAKTSAPWEQWDHKYARLDDTMKLHYVEVGPRDGIPVVLVHGWPDLWFAWRHQMGPLSKKYRVIAPDLRGFGRSGKPLDPAQYGSKVITNDLARLLDVLEIPRAVFIGHDWGGAIVWRMCLYHPSRVLAVCGVCTPYFPPSQTYVDLDTLVAHVPQFKYQQFLAEGDAAAKVLDQATRRFFTLMFRRFHELDHDVEMVDHMRNAATSDHPAFTQASDMLTDAERDYYVREYTQSGFRASLNWYTTRALDFQTEKDLPAVIPHKALYIGAAKDRVLKPELAAHMPKLMPQLEMKTIEKAGHWILSEQREQVTNTLLTWLDKVDKLAQP
ncbi:hypothetical protein Poli38472_004746 [Pythium oligandrum]|uniref:AB hydrolase-1 domain-containing protein n=1 Tax=Pythium oligandrum TaxID=41045 RepID=A0A8K1CAN6_PYTOL|nr:hypothetical protein Poli38472_004746 [Pythium oligandrum]|eukprot:TMW59677.1 hypothetical protein Poli38472_004746 [Pythium oligandrum]